MRHRLTYSNVVATLALFIALGGTGYAAATITSGDIKNRTIKGGDVKKNALGGTEINESKLREVPAARRAQTAAGADISKQADSATQANVAGKALDADALAGQGAGAFEKSSRVQFASAPLAPSSSGEERTLFSWPAMGVELKTSSVACGADQVRLRLIKTHGPYTEVLEGGTSKGTFVGGQTPSLCSTAAKIWDGTLANQTGLTLSFECVNVANTELRCFAIRSEP
jgi:hypothetical protein